MPDFGLVFIIAVMLTIVTGFAVGKAANNMGLGGAVTIGLMAIGVFMIAARILRVLP